MIDSDRLDRAIASVKREGCSAEHAARIYGVSEYDVLYALMELDAEEGEEDTNLCEVELDFSSFEQVIEDIEAKNN